MKPPKDAKPPPAVACSSERMTWEKHRQDTSAFLWGTWIALFGTVAIGHQALHGLRTGEWVDLSAKGWGYLVPWWVAAAVSLGFLLFSLWCLVEYLKLKMKAPKHAPRDEGTDDV